jgi:signal transduction histidine kinase
VTGPGALTRHFRQRMLPLAALAGLTVALIPPGVYALFAWQRLQAEARLDAAQVARGLRQLIERQPWLWRYSADKVVRATQLDARRQGRVRTQITDCEGRVLFPPDAPPLPRRAPEAWAPVGVGGATVAWVHVVVPLAEEARALILIAGLALAAGTLLLLVLYLYPVRVLERQAARLVAALRELEAARLTARVVAVQEEERLRIARDLHDGVGQSLVALQLEVALAGRADDRAELTARLAAAQASCEATLAELRRVVYDLRPPELDDDLAEVLRGYAERFERRSGLPTSFRLEGTPGELPAPLATCLLRVLQEALTNVARHAGAGEVGVTLAFSPEAVRLAVIDDGRGVAGAAEGAGLRGIRERAAFLGGEARIDSDAQGTRVEVRLPRGAR